MSSSGQGSKTKQELLDEYEKDYLTRLGNKKPTYAKPSQVSKIEELADLQNLVLQVQKESKELEVNDYVANCAACKKPVEKDDLKYANGHEFHAECFEIHGNEFEPINYDLLNKTSRMKIELTLLKNLQNRNAGSGKKSTSNASKPKRKTSKKKRTSRKKKRTKSKRKVKRKTRTKKRTSRRKPKRKASRRKTKRKTSKRKTKRRTATKKRTSRRKAKRKASRRKTKKSSRRKTRRRR